MNEYQVAISRLHTAILKKHLRGDHLSGPDPVGKIHWRITRFIRSYLSFLPGEDQYTYLQGMAYWIKSNLTLYQFAGQPLYLDIAKKAADYIVHNQSVEGAWTHPPIWGRKGFISTVEGVWASLGLVAAYNTTGRTEYFESASMWFDFQIREVGFQEVDDGLAVNYYSHSTHVVPNVTTMFLWLSAELYNVNGDQKYLIHSDRNLRFIQSVQSESGELPYVHLKRPHFICYQYNAFQFLDLAAYYRLFPDEQLRGILERLSKFLATGLTAEGSCRYDCSHETPEVNYWTGALAAALRKADELGFGDYSILSELAYQHLLFNQRNDGGFDFSTRNYAFLSDRRSYPRYLAMILYHLIYRVDTPHLDIDAKNLRDVAI